MDTAHEPFGDPWYFGPELMAERFQNDKQAREETGMSQITYKDVLNSLLEPGTRVSLEEK